MALFSEVGRAAFNPFGATSGGLTGALGGFGGLTESGTMRTGPGASPLEIISAQMLQRQLPQFEQFTLAGGPTLEEQTTATRDLRSMLQQMAQTGGMPTETDITQAAGISQQLFAPQQERLSQIFQQQGIEARRQAAQLGRSSIDPILQARLRTQQAQQAGMLSAQQAAQTQQIAMQLPQQRLSFQEALAQQGIRNRQSILQMGAQIQQPMFAARLGSAQGTETSRASLASLLMGAGTIGASAIGG